MKINGNMKENTQDKKPAIICPKSGITVDSVSHIGCSFCGNQKSCKTSLDKLNKEQDETNKTISGTNTTK